MRFRLPIRRVSLVRVLFGCLLVGPSAHGLQACTDSDDPAKPGLDLDASLDGSTPAADTGTPDGGSPDVAIDSPATGPVTIVVVDPQGAPVANVQIAFYDGANVTVQVTGADGRATHVMGTGHVTVADGTVDGAKRLTTFMSVEPGDVINVTGGVDNGAPADPIVGTIARGTLQTFAGANSHEITIGCSSTSIETATPLHILKSCNLGSATTVPVLGVARASNGTVLAYAVKQVALSMADAGDASAITGTISIATGDWVAATAGQTTFGGSLPSFVEAYGQEVSIWKDGRRYVNRFDSDMPEAGAPHDVPPATFGANFLRAYSTLAFRGGVDGDASFTYLPASIVLDQRAMPADGNVARSWSDFLPRIQDVTFEGNATTQKATWTTDAPVNGVGGIVYMTGGITREATLDTLEWRAVFPPGASSMELPALPAQLADFRPTGELALQTLALFDSPEVKTYKVFRATAGKYFFVADADDTISLPGTAPFTTKITVLKAPGG